MVYFRQRTAELGGGEWGGGGGGFQPEQVFYLDLELAKTIMHHLLKLETLGKVILHCHGNQLSPGQGT